MNHQNQCVTLASVSLGVVMATFLAAGAIAQHKHRSELLHVELELKAECIAILLRDVPRKEWRAVAIENRDDPTTCQRAMAKSPNTLPMKGDNWLDRLDVGREVMEPTQ